MFSGSSVNKVFLIGQIAEEPRLQKVTGDGKALYFILITSETVQRGGKALELSEQHHVVIYNDLAATFSEKISKGQMVVLEGKLRTRNYLDEQQYKRYLVEIIVSSFKILIDQTSTP